jgi:molybdopterin-guanine dinucleotide biosynthesis protein A
MKSDVVVVILAGGEGRRIGGDKPLKRFGGERLIDRALRQAHQWSDLIVIAVRDAAQLEPLHAPLIKDEDIPGPLGGLLSALRFARTNNRSFLLAVPVDMPFLPEDLLDRLSDAIGDRACALSMSGGHMHPVCSLWRSDALGTAETYAASGRRSLKGLAAALGHLEVEWPAQPLDPFFNINTSEDLAEAARRDG